MALVVPSRMMKNSRNQNSMSPALQSSMMITWGLVRRRRLVVHNLRLCSGLRSTSLAGFCRPGNSAILDACSVCIGKKAELWKRVFTTSKGHVITAPDVPATLKLRKIKKINKKPLLKIQLNFEFSLIRFITEKNHKRKHTKQIKCFIYFNANSWLFNAIFFLWVYVNFSK